VQSTKGGGKVSDDVENRMVLDYEWTWLHDDEEEEEKEGWPYGERVDD
jgi:hypothetical protein